MSVKNASKMKQIAVYNVLKNLSLLPKTSVTTERSNDEVINVIWVCNSQVYVPDFKFVWCSSKQHYRVYIHIAHVDYDKVNAGYSICTVANGYVASIFALIYGFLHKYRANNKESAKA